MITQTITQVWSVNAEGAREELLSETDGAFTSDKLHKATRDVTALAALFDEDAKAPIEAEVVEPDATVEE